MKLETDKKIRLLKITIAELERRIQFISTPKEVDEVNKEHLETLAENVRLMVKDIIKELNK